MDCVVFYISGHGLGHAARSAEVIRALHARNPRLKIVVRSGAAPWFLAERLPLEIPVAPVRLDVGALQRDSFDADPRATLEAYGELISRRTEIVSAEATVLRDARASLVVCDIPPLAVEAAVAAGAPSLVLANFLWDWIYAPFVSQHPRFAYLLEDIQRSYGLASLLLRLPMHGPMEDGAPIVDVPLIAQKASRSRAEVRAALGVSSHQRLVLVSFGGFGVREIGLSACEEHPEIRFVGAPFAREGEIFPPRPLGHTDVLAAADAVVSKPGFSMFAECLAHGVPIAYVPRSDFVESEVLALALEHRGWPHLRLSLEDLRSGHFAHRIAAFLEDIGRPSPVPAGGAEIVADLIVEHPAIKS